MRLVGKTKRQILKTTTKNKLQRNFMSINIDKVKSKLNEMKSQNNGGTSRIWKPEEGTQRIRMVPYRFNKDYPFIELYFHYDLPGRSFLSPKSFGDADPIVEFADELKRKGGDENYQLAKKLEPTLRIYAPVVERGVEEEGVKFWGFSRTIYEELLGYLADEEWGNFFDLEEGRDLKIDRTPAEKSDTNFPQTDVRPSPTKTPLADSKDEMKDILDTQVKVTEIFDVPSYDELQDRLDDYLEPDEGGSDGSESASANSSDNFEDEDEGVDVDEVTNEFSEIFDE